MSEMSFPTHTFYSELIRVQSFSTKISLLETRKLCFNCHLATRLIIQKQSEGILSPDNTVCDFSFFLLRSQEDLSFVLDALKFYDAVAWRRRVSKHSAGALGAFTLESHILW